MANLVSAALRKIIWDRAGQRCEYCQLHEDDSGYTHQVDHVVSRKHGGQTILGNLALCCIVCNRFKGSDIASLDAEGRAVLFFNPRSDQWADHFKISGPHIVPRTKTGAATIRILQMNSTERIEERHNLQILGTYPRQ